MELGTGMGTTRKTATWGTRRSVSVKHLAPSFPPGLEQPALPHNVQRPTLASQGNLAVEGCHFLGVLRARELEAAGSQVMGQSA